MRHWQCLFFQRVTYSQFVDIIVHIQVIIVGVFLFFIVSSSVLVDCGAGFLFSARYLMDTEVVFILKLLKRAVPFQGN